MKKQKGITLIALVITIIVLIILAVISINVVFGDEGILARALEGQEKQKMAEAREEVQLMITDYVVEREVNSKELIEYLLEQKGKGYLNEVTDNEDGTITVEVDGYNVTIVEETLEVKEEVVKNENAVKVTLSANTAKKDETIKATISLGSNIDSSKIKWAYTTDETLGIEDETKYPNTLSGNEIELTASEEGTYYLHILVVDKDGNKREKIVGPINIGNYVTEITLNKTELSIEEGETETLTMTVEPDDASNKQVEWTSSDEEIAAVDENGLITGKKEGETVITVTAKDGSGTKATCKVTITEAPPIKEGEATHEATTLSYSWSELHEIAKVISNTNLQEDVEESGEITSDTAEVKLNIDGKAYTIGVGDTKTLTIGETNYVVRVMGFNHDKLTSTSAYGQEGKTNVYAGISFEFVDFLTTATINGTKSSNSTNAGGWAASEMYTTVSGYQDDVETAMGGTYLKQVEKKYLAKYNSTTQSTSSDYLWLLACSEIWSTGARYNGSTAYVLTSGAYGYAYASEGDQYKYYKIKETGDSSYSTANNNFKKPSSVSGSADDGGTWWLRSSANGTNKVWCHVSKTGDCTTDQTGYTKSVAPCFSI